MLSHPCYDNRKWDFTNRKKGWSQSLYLPDLDHPRSRCIAWMFHGAIENHYRRSETLESVAHPDITPIYGIMRHDPRSQPATEAYVLYEVRNEVGKKEDWMCANISLNYGDQRAITIGKHCSRILAKGGPRITEAEEAEAEMLILSTDTFVLKRGNIDPTMTLKLISRKARDVKLRNKRKSEGEPIGGTLPVRGKSDSPAARQRSKSRSPSVQDEPMVSRPASSNSGADTPEPGSRASGQAGHLTHGQAEHTRVKRVRHWTEKQYSALQSVIMANPTASKEQRLEALRRVNALEPGKPPRSEPTISRHWKDRSVHVACSPVTAPRSC